MVLYGQNMSEFWQHTVNVNNKKRHMLMVTIILILQQNFITTKSADTLIPDKTEKQ
jgi:hypothetical protein